MNTKSTNIIQEPMTMNIRGTLLLSGERTKPRHASNGERYNIGPCVVERMNKRSLLVFRSYEDES